MNWSPCGAAVDIGRYSYDEEVKVFRNSDATAGIHWYPAIASAPALPFPSRLLYHQWDSPYLELDGSYYGPETPNPPWNGAKENPDAIGLHQCGTPEDFAFGGYYDPLRTPVEYRPDGLPVCCSPIFTGIGGAVGGGTATVTYQGPYSGSGGAVGGGSALFYWGTQYTGIGGAVGSGTATVLTQRDRIGSGGGVGSGTANVQHTQFIFGIGGGVGSGTATVLNQNDRIGTGGGVGSGTATVTAGEVRTGTGGGVGSGTATTSYTPPAPGPTCLTALDASDSITYVETATFGTKAWFKFSKPAGPPNVDITYLSLGMVHGSATVWRGSCAGLLFTASLLAFGTGTIVLTSAAVDLFLEITPGSSGGYSVQFVAY